MASYKPVVAALRVLDVLASVNRLNGQATVGEIHQQTKIDKATIVRMLETLAHAGYTVRDPDKPIYGITGKTLTLSAGYDRHKSFSAIISPLLHAFQNEIGWPSDIALFDNDAMLVVETSRQGGPLTFNRAAGFRAPVLGTSLGLAYMAHCPEAESEVFRQRAQTGPGPWNDVAREPELYQKTLAKIRDQGYATMDMAYSSQEYGNKVFSIGVPIRSASTVYGAINVIYLKQALTAEAAQTTLLPSLKAVATEMAAALQAHAQPAP